MLRLILIIALLLPSSRALAGLPYTVVRDIDEMCNAAEQVDGIDCDWSMQVEPQDKARLKLFLKTPENLRQIDLRSDGTFSLPLLDPHLWERSEFVHNLKPGAVEFQFRFGLGGRTAAQRARGRFIDEWCGEVVAAMRGIDGMQEVLLRHNQPAGRPEAAVVGLSIAPRQAMTGEVLLKRGDLVMQSADLSQPGATVWMFDEYDPREHSLDWEAAREQEPPPINIFFVFGALNDSDQAERVIPLWRVEPEPPSADAVLESPETVNPKPESEAPADSGGR